jgi:hypothetical protein
MARQTHLLKAAREVACGNRGLHVLAADYAGFVASVGNQCDRCKAGKLFAFLSKRAAGAEAVIAAQADAWEPEADADAWKARDDALIAAHRAKRAA